MQPTSSAQFEGFVRGPLPPLEEVREDIWALPVGFPDPIIRYTLSYLLRDSEGRFHVIDPGWEFGRELDAVPCRARSSRAR